MKSLNKVSLIGNLGNTPEFQVLENGIALAKLSLATSDSFKDKNGQLHTETEWHTIILWQNLAEIAHKFLNKGSLVYIEGKIKTRNYTDKEGIKKFVTEIIADQLIMLDKKEK